MLVTADMVGLYPSIPHSADLNCLKKALENRGKNQILTSDLVKMAKSVLTITILSFLKKLFNKYQEQL